ncbi:MAG: hypothetical protein K8R74_00925 [Bacteroidales bacterium]|nr:hypothetical protein [Bacteroidales bacterium]
MKKTNVGYLIIASAIIWGAVIVGCSYKLKGTECYEAISNILFAGVIMHFLLIWAPLGSQLRKKKEGEVK